DYEVSLARVAELAVPYVADWCVAHIADSNGGLRRVALASEGMARDDRAQRVEELIEAEDELGPAAVVRSGRTEVLPELEGSPPRSEADERRLATLTRLGLRSFLCVPLVARERILGVLTFATSESGRRYGQADLTL